MTLSEEQDNGEAGITKHREERGDQHIEQEVARQRSEDHLDARRLDHRPRRDADPLQGEDDESEPDQDASKTTDGLGLPCEEQHHADKDQQWREP